MTGTPSPSSIERVHADQWINQGDSEGCAFTSPRRQRPTGPGHAAVEATTLTHNGFCIAGTSWEDRLRRRKLAGKPEELPQWPGWVVERTRCAGGCRWR